MSVRPLESRGTKPSEPKSASWPGRSRNVRCHRNDSCIDRLLARYDSERLSALSADRRRASLRALRDFQALCDDVDLARADGRTVGRLLAVWEATGAGAGTVRKGLAILRAFYAWAYNDGLIDAETLIAVRAVRPLATASRAAEPQPYRLSELRRLRATLDERWPKLAEDEVWKWLYRYRDGRSPYSRVRTHAIRCQLDAIIALALHLGLRRREIFALDILTAHSDNDELIVWTDSECSIGKCRAVPVTEGERAAMSAWLDCRYAIAPEHKQLWLNVHAEPTNRKPMTAESFNRVLATYIGQGWTLKRLRDTRAAGWVRAGLGLEHLRELLGLARIEDTLPYARLVRGSLDGRMTELDEHFSELVGPVTITDVAA